jgi:hypothetical protein
LATADERKGTKLKLTPIILIAIVGSNALIASPETRERYAASTGSLYSRFESINSGAQSSPQEIVTLLQQIEGAWQPLSLEDKQFLGNRRWHDYRSAALLLTNYGAYELASESLRKHAELCRQLGMSAEGASASTYQEFAKLHAAVAQATGTDPLAGMTDYLFRQQGNKYIVARQEPDPTVKGITVDGVAESEKLAQVLELSAQDGQAIIDRTRWVIGPKGKIEETLRHATREVSFDEDGRLSARPLKAPVFTAEAKSPEPAPARNSATSAPMIPSPTVTPEVPRTPTTPIAPIPATPIEKRGPPWPWLVGIIVLLVIVALVAKRRA